MTELDIYHQYRCLRVIVSDIEFISNLKKRMSEQLKPLRTLVSKDHDIVNIARFFYLAHIRSVVDYHTLYLVLFKESVN